MKKIYIQLSYIRNTLSFFAIRSALTFTQTVSAEDQTIDMLNKLGKENMVFSKKIVKINIGEKVFWKGVKKGHNVEFI